MVACLSTTVGSRLARLQPHAWEMLYTAWSRQRDNAPCATIYIQCTESDYKVYLVKKNEQFVVYNVCVVLVQRERARTLQ
jgi:hypothetical protein